MVPYHWTQVVNIKRDPFEISIGSQYKTLMKAVIAHYEADFPVRDSISPNLIKVSLSDAQEDDLLAFLATLTADEAAVPTPILPTK